MESEGRNMKGESDLTDVIDAIDVTDSNVPEFLMALILFHRTPLRVVCGSREASSV